MTEDAARRLRCPPGTLDRAAFLSLYGGVYEHSPWIAEAVWARCAGGALDTLGALHGAMKAEVDAASDARKLALIQAHPDLAGRAAIAGRVTRDSAAEQSGAGLDRCSPEEFAAFQELNAAYKEKFGFPFILAIKGLTRHTILEAFRARLGHARAHEMKEALAQIHRIAWLRLRDLT